MNLDTNNPDEIQKYCADYQYAVKEFNYYGHLFSDQTWKIIAVSLGMMKEAFDKDWETISQQSC